ncbi:hypothetical protein OWR29_45785 [Actinoplanes sp. Pm04-4]|uniref:Uncharacterized protein n=1 Tax=Paractinoplanes pyxinae TaxID=2997416 RepID=A0ABT4BFN0_9ACTN|nr:hypothetical protein [Actinoplanes pyxinae]MCY1145359.1 hypothetical protein [Actinoplanes pyxinae]
MRNNPKISRRRMVVGGVGLAAVLGTGAILLTANSERDSTATAPNPTPAASSSPASSPSPDAPAGSASSAPASAGPAVPSPAVSASPKTLQERLAAARSANKRLGTEPRHAPPPNGNEIHSAVTVKNQGDIRKGGKTLRIVSARQDLTGLRELAWVADEGKPAGKARCTQNIRLYNNPKPRERPTLLLCWRTTADKSVYTVAVDVNERPSTAESLKAIERRWAEMG